RPRLPGLAGYAAGAGAFGPEPRTSLPQRHQRASGTTKRSAARRASGTTSREGGRQMTDRPVAVLIGPPGAGKSTVGQLLAALLGAEFAETDQMVEAAAGKPVSDIFVTDGEPVFRDLERAAVARALEQHPGI